MHSGSNGKTKVQTKATNLQTFKMSEIDEVVKRIQANPGVEGIIILSHEGIPLRTTMDYQYTVQVCALMLDFVIKARNTIHELDSQNDLSFVRLRSKQHEIMCAPEGDYLMVVIQKPSIRIC